MKTLDLRDDNPALGIPPVLAQTDSPALILQTYFAAHRPLLKQKHSWWGKGVSKTLPPAPPH
ncbi:MAG: hypothetical protein H6658_04730 [Ardenticatenaceae bacterium]|nr:hypothetical protein [Ardenticatenaceae bacterium]